MKSFAEEFDIKLKNDKQVEVNDYDAFPNKNLLDELRNKIIQNLIDNHTNASSDITSLVKKEIDSSIEGYDLTNVEISYLYNMIDNEINGFGPITDLLEDPNVTEIMVNDIDKIYVEINGKLVKDDSVSFINSEHIIRTIQRMIQPIGRTIDSSNPMVDARLNDGSRLNAIIPPLAINGPTLTIRKFKDDLVSMEDLVRTGALTKDMALFLEASVKAKLNIIVCGGTSSGKTTLLNILSSFINHDERIITIEDAAELRLKQPHVVSLETRLTNYEGDGEITIRDLVINSLRMRPDRIIVGEVRGSEAFDMLQAMNTGHSGSMTTVHANGTIDALNRLETLILMAGMDIPVKAIREYINDAINIIVHTERFSDGSRKIVEIAEITGLKDDDIILNSIFKYNQIDILDSGKVYGEFSQSKKIPNVYKQMKTYGIDSIKDLFEK